MINEKCCDNASYIENEKHTAIYCKSCGTIKSFPEFIITPIENHYHYHYTYPQIQPPYYNPANPMFPNSPWCGDLIPLSPTIPNTCVNNYNDSLYINEKANRLYNDKNSSVVNHVDNSPFLGSRFPNTAF